MDNITTYPIPRQPNKKWLLGSVKHCCLALQLVLLTFSSSFAQFGSDLGRNAVSTLAWQDISASQEGGSNGDAIGLTTDGRVYMWGDNKYFMINGNQNVNKVPLYQTAPYYKPMPEVITKVKIMWASNNQSAAASYPNDIYTYFALGQSGKLYVWGVNTGLFGSTWPGASIPSDTDTTKVSRTPTPLTVAGESGIVDFTARNGTLVVLGASGKAYVLGYYTAALIATTFKALPNPAGVGSSFKYTKLWGTVADGGFALHLKGNDGNIYLTYSRTFSLSTGVPSLFNIGYTPGGGLPFGYGQYQDPTASTSNPVLVPFPAGEDIIHIEYDRSINNSPSGGNSHKTFAISSSGKAYMTGLWRVSNIYNTWQSKTVYCPLKQEPAASDVYNVITNSDTTVYVKRFVEVAMPPGATGVLDIKEGGFGGIGATMIIGNNHKVYWSGRVSRESGFEYGNFLGDSYYVSNPPPKTDQCDYMYPITSSRYQWSFEAINFSGAARIITDDYPSNYNFFIISASGRGYFVGQKYGWARNGLGKSKPYEAAFPTPIANEQLLSCNTSAGTGGPLGDPVSTPAAGVIDCSKTKLYPAPVQGTPSQLSLLVTVNVTTAGLFSPITVSGSGMSLPSSFSSLNVESAGVQTLHIPINYDGSTLTNAFQFTIGQAGSCSADLTQQPSQVVTNVWTLNNCTAITPGTLSK